MEEIFFKIFKEEKGIAGIISYSLNAGTFRENNIHGNISKNNRAFHQSVANSIHDLDDFEEASRNQINSDFPFHKDWVVDEIEYEDVIEAKEEIDYFLKEI